MENPGAKIFSTTGGRPVHFGGVVMHCERSIRDLLREKGTGESSPQAAYIKGLWSIILAGGNGDRISELTLQMTGRKTPKQYCAFTGTKSMLRHTLLRADMLSPRNRQCIVIAEEHKGEALPQLEDRWPGGIILQPRNRDTFPGIFLPLTHVFARDSNATVIFFPSDHFIFPRENFGRLVRDAVRVVEELPHKLLLLGASPDRPEPDYGWIWPGSTVGNSGGHPVAEIKRFLEKPSQTKAADAMACGGLWNTLILAGKARTLWRLGHDFFPEIMQYFERLYNAIGSSRETGELRSIYEVMPSCNFSYDFLTQAIDNICVLPMKDVEWSDWGRKERIHETLVRFGKKPNFKMILAGGGAKSGSFSGFGNVRESEKVPLYG
jgi:mannose-1-phosphate guanylyltransferase